MEENSENIGNTLSEFVHDYGAPSHLMFDGAAVHQESNTLFYLNFLTPRRPERNPAEQAIRELKGRRYRIQTKLNIPDRLWDFGMSYIAETSNIIAMSSLYSKGRTKTTGSNYRRHSLYY